MILLALGSSSVSVSEARSADFSPALRAGEPQLILTKSVDEDITSAKVGQIIFFRIRFACSSLTIDCGDVEIVDALPTNPNPPNNPLLTYVAALSSVPAGFHMTESPVGTLTITKDDHMLLDGSQYDAVIAARVNYETRPLPATVSNAAVGRIKPPGATSWSAPVTSTTPSLDIEAPVADWTLTKTLFSPSIEPTVDTDVTYRINLCPNTTEGNVALTDVAITDTLPPGAQFVSASNGGTESGGIVTWNIPGPVTPPACVTRYVTMRFNTADGWAVGDPVTNTAAATGDYLDSDGNPCPNCVSTGTIPLNHHIINIVETPTFSKDDVGDPVGIDGTARFVLNLNTNGTNYPANAVVMTDTLPGELEVVSVTSGTWQADDYVRATIQYTTKYNPAPGDWVNFPSQPVDYNDNALYDSGLPNNIAKIRWVFEYDSDPDDLNGNGSVDPLPGLPFDWSFSSQPEIRVIPRKVAANSDDSPAVSMPVAVPGNTYINCLQVSRVDSGGNPTTSACNNEDMTVEGNFVSLRTTKAETPGYGYDPVADPNINTFTADSSILPNDTVKYTLTVEVTERSSVDLVNPVIQDTLPPELIFVRNGVAKLDGSPLANQPHFYQSGSTLTWAWTDNSIPPGINIPPLSANPLTVPAEDYGSHYLTVEFYGYIQPGTAPANYTNSMYVVTDTGDVHCEVGTTAADGSDLDNDGDATENRCQNSDTFKVERSAALRGEKWIRSVSADNAVAVNKDTFAPDASCPNGGNAGLPGSSNSFTRYPCISQAYPEGGLSPTDYAPPPADATIDDFEYNLRIFNEGNVPMLEYVLYDILPYYGDKGSGGTLVNEARNSEFRPALTGPVSFISGPAPLDASDFLIQYSASTNPCRPEVFDKNPVAYPNTPAGCTNDWMDAVAAAALGWENIRAYRIELINDSIAAAVPAGQELRFGVPMHIPADAPIIGSFNQDDAQSKEIAWNSYSHVGAYDKDEGPGITIQDLLASEPRKVGVTIPERFSIGNRVWRDSDNSGTINPPDDVNPGIEDVVVNLYLDANGDGIPDGAAIASTLTDIGGYYLFSNLPAGKYIVGIPASNFTAGQPLYNLRSSTGTPPSATYTNPTDPNPDSADHGIDPAVVGNEVFSPTITLSAASEQTSESDLSSNDRDGPPGTRRGVNGERDNNSDLTVDFGFFGGSDIPFSIGNHLWYDNGAGGGTINNGYRDGAEPPVVNARVDLYRDGNLNGIPESNELIRWDFTDANGFYLFDNLDPGSYYVVVSASNFQSGGPLAGWHSSFSAGSETVGLNGGNLLADIDGDDNGLDNDFPENNGIRSDVIVLQRGVLEPTGETFLSGEPDPDGNPMTPNLGVNPTEWDGPDSRGRYGEPDENSNLTIDFGFIPPMSLGNRVWMDNGAGEAVFRSQYNNGIMDGTEAGVPGVTLQLWRDNGDSVFNSASDTMLRVTTTDAAGYYLFDRLQPGDYFIRIPASNFASGAPLYQTISSFDNVQPTLPADDLEDKDDNGIDNANPAVNGVTSPKITMQYDSEPLTPGNETDINNSGTYGPNNVGLFGQADGDSNLTMDFGFVYPPRSVGNFVWYDTGAGANTNNGILNLDELPVPNVLVRLYLDANGNGIPDDVNNDSVLDVNDSIAYDVTDGEGYYLFDNLPPNRYLIAVDSDNFNPGGFEALVGYASSVGVLTPDSRDHGNDRVLPGDPVASPYGIISSVVDLRLGAAIPTGETAFSSDSSSALGFNPTAGDGSGHIGRYGETDATSNLRIDFGFFKPMSLGNRVFYDNGAGANLNNGVMDADESGIPGVRVELYRDNGDGIFNPASDTYIGHDITDAGGYYLFDRLNPGNYFVRLPASNFTGAGVLRGWSNSVPTFNDDVDINDNGVNNAHPHLNGIVSNLVTLAVDAAPEFESQLSGATTNPGPPTNDDFNPTSWDGPNSRGRWNETDKNSNLTVDFGFIPPLSLGNRVWIDDGSTAGGLNLTQFNNRLMDGTEAGRAGVLLNLYFDANNDGDYNDTVDGVPESAPYKTYVTDADGYYLFDGLPEGRYYVQVAPSNFASGGALEGYLSSTGADDDETGDLNDNGQDSPTYLADGIRSMDFILNYGSEPLAEPDVSSDTTAYGPNGRGRYGEADGNSNLTLDFGFVSVRSLGNRVWLDNGGTTGTPNNGILDGDEAGVDGVTLSLYLDQDGDGIPDGPAVRTTTTSDGGYYLFGNLPPERYIVGVDSSNFAPGNPLYQTASSVSVPAPVDATADLNDHGIDAILPATNGILSPTIDLRGIPSSEPTGETDLSGRPADGPNSRGVNGEADADSDLTVDFGFYYPMSLGNRVWRDDGAGAFYDNGVMDAGELGISNVRVELYRDDGDGVFNAASDTFLRHDATDANGFYLFDGLIPGDYFVYLPASNFVSGGALFGLNNSTPTFGNDADINDNGVNNPRPDLNGIVGNLITLVLNNAPTGETDLSAEADPGAPGNAANDPTGWDGPFSRGRYDETDNNANLTVDFGFLPVYSLGNRVWFDMGNTSGVANNGILDGDELGVAGATVNLYLDMNNDGVPDDINVIGNPADDVFLTMLTDANGYYRFDNLRAGTYIVEVVPPGPGYASTIDSNQDPDNDVDNNDDGVIVLPTGEVRSKPVTLGGATPEPTGDNDPAANPDSANGEAPNDQSNRTVDFGFVASVAIGNVVWFDMGAGDHYNNGIFDADESPVPDGVTVELYNAATNTKVVTGPDGIPNSGDEGMGEVTTVNGFYQFDKLVPGDYYVLIPAFEFQAGGRLFGYMSSTDSVPATTDQTIDHNADENGQDATTANLQANGIRTLTYTLTPGLMPTADMDMSGEGGSYTGTLSDDSVNFTADFGFTQLVALGNRVWFDIGTGGGIPNNGKQDGGEAGVPNVTVELYASGQTPGVDTPLRTTQTDGNGNYQFDGLRPGDYFVHIPAAEFQSGGDLFGYSSSAGQGADKTTDQDADENGSDAQPAINGVSSQVYSLSLNGEPTTDDETSYTGVLDDNDVNFTADFGFTALIAIGNRVWYDTDAIGYNNGVFDAGETGIDGITVHLYYDADNNGTFSGGELTPYRSTTTAGGGFYVFDNLLPGRYYVEIPASEFLKPQLVGYTSSTGSGGDQSLDDDIDENGQDTLTPLADGIRSIEYVLTPGLMPTTDNETSYTGVLDDHNVNFTADFGFVEAYSLGNRVWHDENRNGIRDAGEGTFANVQVNLYRDLNNDDVPDGGIILTVFTDANGYYRFDSLPAGNYIVEVVSPAGYASTIDAGDPDVDDGDDDDNGVFFFGGNVRSHAVTLGGVPEPTGETNPAANPESNGEAPDARSNRTVDFGFFLSDAQAQKQLTGATMMDNGPVPGMDVTTLPQAAIGEVLTYVATLNIPSAANLTDLVAVDTLDAGLAFVGCDSITAPNLNVSNPLADICANATVSPSGGGYADGSQVTFSFGVVENLTADTQPLTITYRVIVLDVPSNQNGVSGLNNSIAWTWGGGSKAPVEAQPVQVVEPDLSISKNASPRAARYGETIRFTVDVAHASQSASDAFDVVMTDVIPAGLTLELASVQVTGTASTPGNFTTNFDPFTNTLTVTWDHFPLGANARVQFDAVFVGPAPVTNSANVAWTSMAIDPQPGGAPVQLSPFNQYSTERWYDPLDSANINTYLVSSSIDIVLRRFNPDNLPSTGFAPGAWTPLPDMPEGFAYAQTSLALEIPALKVKANIVGVPFDEEKNDWTLTWLYKDVGWLQNTAFPTYNGNSALTAHAYLADGTPGPFAKIGSLGRGDRIIVHLGGQKYIYEVREVKRVRPWAVNAALKHEEKPWLTLITCQQYDETSKQYLYRVVVRAVLIAVE